ncbi:ac146 [Lambdina fiscellaria nucleopolyhedrovirus]|uniref:Ac146 n=1 Tax=Lambdina fiscellaria nucleopolyhedrovirus TaxID=1642929 RepID=A0A0E3Z6V1_9ABAC|nr:ac146 [Lambdina fiscellaria nucleopolyhedrovirus]AKC91756.1 ac146 [Lambdina fiscellaria nucleopolyhedrovirus]
MNVNLVYPVTQEKIITFTMCNTLNSIVVFVFNYFKSTCSIAVSNSSSSTPYFDGAGSNEENVALFNKENYCFDNNGNIDTQLVSGYEKHDNKICINVSCCKDSDEGAIELNSEKNNTISTTVASQRNLNAYMVSCIRLPYLARKLVNLPIFNVPLAAAVMQVKRRQNSNNEGGNNGLCENDGKCQELQVWHVIGVRRGREPAAFKRINGVVIDERGVEKFYQKEVIELRGNIPSAFVQNLQRAVAHYDDCQVMGFVYPHLHINDNAVHLIYKDDNDG